MRSFEAYSQPRMSISVISVSWGGGGESQGILVTIMDQTRAVLDFTVCWGARF